MPWKCFISRFWKLNYKRYDMTYCICRYSLLHAHLTDRNITICVFLNLWSRNSWDYRSKCFLGRWIRIHRPFCTIGSLCGIKSCGFCLLTSYGFCLVDSVLWQNTYLTIYETCMIFIFMRNLYNTNTHFKNIYLTLSCLHDSTWHIWIEASDDRQQILRELDCILVLVLTVNCDGFFYG